MVDPVAVACVPRRVFHGVRINGAFAVAISTVVLLGGCGSSGSSSPSPSAPTPSPTPSKAPQISSADACKLVTADDASAAVGTAVSNLATSAGVPFPGACIYGRSDGKASVFVYAQVYPDSSAALAAAPEQLAATLGGAYGVANAKAVSGIGDKAVEYTGTSAAGIGIVIFVFKSNVVMMLAVTPSPGPTAVEHLATIAVGRL